MSLDYTVIPDYNSTNVDIYLPRMNDSKIKLLMMCTLANIRASIL